MKRQICFLMVVLLLAGCKTTKHIQRAQDVKTDPNRQLVEQVIAVQPSFRSLQVAKAKFKLDYEKHSYNVSGSINILTDSAIVLSLQPLLGIELYRMEIQPQQITVIDKMNRRYVRMSYDELQKQTGLNVEFKDIQALLCNQIFTVGTPQAELPNKKALVKDGLTEQQILYTDDKLNYTFTIDKKSLQLLETQIGMNGKTGMSAVKYINHRMWNEIVFPEQMEISATTPSIEGTCLVSFQQISFNDKVNITPANIQKYTATSLSSIIK